jgi:hypothetical protein
MRHLIINPIILSEAEIESMQAEAQREPADAPLAAWDQLTDADIAELVRDDRR